MELSTLCKQYNFTLTQIRPIHGSEAELADLVSRTVHFNPSVSWRNCDIL